MKSVLWWFVTIWTIEWWCWGEAEQMQGSMLGFKMQKCIGRRKNASREEKMHQVAKKCSSSAMDHFNYYLPIEKIWKVIKVFEWRLPFDPYAIISILLKEGNGDQNCFRASAPTTLSPQICWMLLLMQYCIGQENSRGGIWVRYWSRAGQHMSIWAYECGIGVGQQAAGWRFVVAPNYDSFLMLIPLFFSGTAPDQRWKWLQCLSKKRWTHAINSHILNYTLFMKMPSRSSSKVLFNILQKETNTCLPSAAAMPAPGKTYFPFFGHSPLHNTY